MLITRLEGVNPLAVLSHGYAMVEGEDGRIISSISEVHPGERVNIGLSDGRVEAEIINVKENIGEV
jgi:exodeoxyribonuclease VII large subunit